MSSARGQGSGQDVRAGRRRARVRARAGGAVVLALCVALLTAPSAAHAGRPSAAPDGVAAPDGRSLGELLRRSVLRPVDLGVPDTVSWATDISESGIVIGWAWQAETGFARAFRWTDGELTYLEKGSAGVVNVHGQVLGHTWVDVAPDPPVIWEPDGTIVPLAAPGQWTGSLDLDDHGRVAGHWYDSETSPPRAALWEDGVLTDIDGLGGGTTRLADRGALNNAGQVAATGVTVDGRTRAFVWRAGVVTELPAPAHLETRALKMLENGSVWGQTVDASGQTRDVVWEDGRMRVLDLQGAYVHHVNAAGYAVGNLEREDGTLRAVLAGRRGTVRLPALGAGSSGAITVNDLGVVVGTAERGDGVHHPVAWVANRPVALGEDLPGFRAVGGYVHDVNERGQVVGRLDGPSAPWTQTHRRAVLWELVPRW